MTQLLKLEKYFCQRYSIQNYKRMSLKWSILIISKKLRQQLRRFWKVHWIPKSWFFSRLTGCPDRDGFFYLKSSFGVEFFSEFLWELFEVNGWDRTLVRTIDQIPFWARHAPDGGSTSGTDPGPCPSYHAWSDSGPWRPVALASPRTLPGARWSPRRQRGTRRRHCPCPARRCGDRWASP